MKAYRVKKTVLVHDSPPHPVSTCMCHVSTCTRPCIRMHAAVYPCQNLAMRYGPHHSTESGSTLLWVTAQNFSKHCGPREIYLDLDTNQIPCIHMHRAVYPRVCGCISTSMRPCIHEHVAVNPRQIWPCAMGPTTAQNLDQALWATVQNFVKRYGPQRRIWLSTMGHCAEFH